ncbi:MAG: hypothetical protein KAR42_08450 [candidate division Zixibacteria bacterium]|nr:hypothetical protein [candidate division Zixibacteria bacterium]
MRKFVVALATFAFALSLGVGITLVTPNDAQALWCPVYQPTYVFTSTPCVCPRGPDGVIVQYWRGYFEDGSKCGYYTYCSTCPPKWMDWPIPHEEPIDDGNR